MTLGTRFLFIFFLAKYIDPASVGQYGLFTATIGYCMYFVGLDFYIYVTREIIAARGDQRGRHLKGQAALSSLLYVAVLPVTILLLNYTGWPANLVWWFAPILVLEHFNQEVFRLLVAMSQQIAASFLLFIRQASWAVAAVALMALEPNSRRLDVVIALWACAGMVTAVFGIIKIRSLGMGGWLLPIDWAWVRKGVVVSTTFLVATLALRGIQTIDRYWLGSLSNLETLGAYVLFIGVAGSLAVFLDAGVFSYGYPELIKLAHERAMPSFRKRLRSMLLQTVCLSAAFSVISWLLLPFLLDWIGNQVYKSALGLYPWVLIAIVANSLGMIPHYALYACGFDRPIIHSHLAALPAFVVSTWLISMYQPMLAVPIGMSIAFAVVLVWKTTAYFRIDDDANALKPSAKSP